MNITADQIHSTAVKTIALRKNASQKSINEAINSLTEAWESDYKNAPIVDVFDGHELLETPGTYYLEIGGVIRWGYSNGFWAWGYSKSDVNSEIAGQKEYAYR